MSLRTFVIPFYYDSGTVAGTVIHYGSGSAKAKSYCSYGSRSATLVPFKALYGDKKKEMTHFEKGRTGQDRTGRTGRTGQDRTGQDRPRR